MKEKGDIDVESDVFSYQIKNSAPLLINKELIFKNTDFLD